jgi:hypothetical protein
MYVKLLSLVCQVLFYELDVGVDIKVAKEQHDLTFFGPRTNQTIFSKEMYTNKGVSSKDLNLNYEPFHFLLSSAWLILAGLFQSLIILTNIKKQKYIPLIWKLAIGVSSFFLLGQLFIYYFAIFTIFASNASIPEKKRIVFLVGSIVNQYFIILYQIVDIVSFLNKCKASRLLEN